MTAFSSHHEVRERLRLRDELISAINAYCPHRDASACYHCAERYVERYTEQLLALYERERR